ncbi:hypothetical protein Tco_1342231, partial [Tanacetum coccineum]
DGQPEHYYGRIHQAEKAPSSHGKGVSTGKLLNIALLPRDQRHQYLRFEGLQYTDTDIADFEVRLGRIYDREVHRVQVFDFGGLTELMDEGLRGRMLMGHRDAQGQTGALQFQLGGVRRRMSWREFILGMGLHTAQGIESAPKKVTTTDLFYLRSMDWGAANVLYLLAQYLFRHAKGRKSGARLSEGHFIGRLAHHFGLVGDDWAWVAQGAERQPVAAVTTPRGVEDALDIDEGTQAVPAPIHALPPPPPITEASGRTYQAFDGTFRGSYPEVFERRTRQRTDDASTSIAQQDKQHPNP